jgi:hypothetical protein
VNNHRLAAIRSSSEAALVALKAFSVALPHGDLDGDLDEILSDLICDLMHLCDDTELGFSHLNFDEILASAKRFYLYETKEKIT